jgi:hypothetical protein
MQRRKEHSKDAFDLFFGVQKKQQDISLWNSNFLLFLFFSFRLFETEHQQKGTKSSMTV